MQTAELGHGRGWLRADAAASLLRVDRQIGHPLDINDAGRTNAEQWEMWRKYGSPRAAYPGTSTHETGIAIDTDERLVDILAANGWSRPFDFEPWHFKYTPADDKHINDTITPDPIKEIHDMDKVILACLRLNGKNTEWALCGAGIPGGVRSTKSQQTANAWARLYQPASIIDNRADWDTLWREARALHSLWADQQKALRA